MEHIDSVENGAERDGNLYNPFFPHERLVPVFEVSKSPHTSPPARCDTKYSLMPPLKGPLHIWGPPYLQHPTAMIIFWELKFDWSLSCSPELSQICPDQQRGSGAHSPDLLPFTPMCRIFHRGLCEGHGFWWLSSQGLATEGDPIRQINT